MSQWVKQFISEIDRVENFYLSKFEEYKNDYDLLNFRYLKKTHETLDHDDDNLMI